MKNIIGNIYHLLGCSAPENFMVTEQYTVRRAGSKKVLLRGNYTGESHYMARQLFEKKVANGTLKLIGWTQLFKGWR